MHRILITGGCGFVGSNLALYLQSACPESHIIAFDNLMRRGSEINKSLLEDQGIECIIGDTRDPKALFSLPEVAVIIDAAAEPAVTAGLSGGPKELLDINLMGTVHCLELARKWQSAFIYLSSSRVYPYEEVNQIPYQELESRFEFTGELYRKGVSESFNGNGSRSFYGASKMASELLVKEYSTHYQIRTVTNRFGVIAGPHQMGKTDQGFIALWIAKHFFNQSLNYIGFGGTGKQVRDVLHVQDACRLVKLQIQNIEKVNGEYFNAGGGWENSISLQELTRLVSNHCGKKIKIGQHKNSREADIRIYYSNNEKIRKALAWTPQKSVMDIIADTYHWLTKHESILAPIFNH